MTNLGALLAVIVFKHRAFRGTSITNSPTYIADILSNDTQDLNFCPATCEGILLYYFNRIINIKV